VYCFGGVLLYLFTGKAPHSTLNALQILMKVHMQKELPAELDLLSNGEEKWRQPLTELVTSCLGADAKDRPSMKSVVASLWSIFNGLCLTSHSFLVLISRAFFSFS
jgi:hypothetical protein